MPLFFVKKARVTAAEMRGEERKCEVCGKRIKVGESYFRYQTSKYDPERRLGRRAIPVQLFYCVDHEEEARLNAPKHVAGAMSKARGYVEVSRDKIENEIIRLSKVVDDRKATGYKVTEAIKEMQRLLEEEYIRLDQIALMQGLQMSTGAKALSARIAKYAHRVKIIAHWLSGYGPHRGMIYKFARQNVDFTRQVTMLIPKVVRELDWIMEAGAEKQARNVMQSALDNATWVPPDSGIIGLAAPVKCEECKSKLTPYESGGVRGWVCENCGWEWSGDGSGDGK